MSHLSPVDRYVTGSARTHMSDAVAYSKRYDLVPAGRDRMFMTQVTAIKGGSATVSTCDDGSKFRQVYASTGQPDNALRTPKDEEYLFETWRMVETSGHWAITSFVLAELPSRSAVHCQP
ncbi:MAG TPA: hypothetical protein VMC03_20780 [Streptosporangiaceae bacterium]|nr:hypothetical protein [Streptosporangiaceae bacterium]